MSERTSTTEQEPQILSFEQFAERSGAIVAYRNFFMYFGGGIAGDIHRGADYYKRFAAENPDMVVSLCNKIQKRDKKLPTSESLRPFDADLYEAYKIMRGYGVSDMELFT